MKKVFMYSALAVASVLCSSAYAWRPNHNLGYEEKPMVVIIPGRNNAEWFEKWNLESVFAQNYTNYRVIYIDDVSDDGTPDLIREYVERVGQQHRFTLIANTERKLSLRNRYEAIHNLCDDREIVVILDADDWFAHSEVLGYLNQAYADPNVWMTYSQFREYPHGAMGWGCDMPKWVVKHHLFRYFSHTPTHLRTFYAGLFKKIRTEDLMYKGDFYKMTEDKAMMLPMIEMSARGHFKFLEQVCYIYNGTNPINDHKINAERQRKLDLIIRSQQPYEPIDTLFN